MSIFEQPIKAQDRTLGVWFHDIQQGRVKLPRFQRFESWDRSRIMSFLNTVINNLPVGVALVLEVEGEEKFHSRYISTAERVSPEIVTHHLLDGQQRLTAFWRAMHNNYESETYFVYIPELDKSDMHDDSMVHIRCVPRWLHKNDSRRPLWVDIPEETLKRGLLPVNLLRPGDLTKEIDNWLIEATKNIKPHKSDSDYSEKFEEYYTIREQIKQELMKLRERVTHFNLPFLSLPASTEKDIALQVFINMNTNSKPLSVYEIIVAEVEDVSGRSLHEMADQLVVKCPTAMRYGDIRDLILSTSALLQDKLPNTRGMIEMDKEVLIDNWKKLEAGLEKMAKLLENQGVFDSVRLPTNAVLAVVSAAYDMIPQEGGDFIAKAEKLLRSYVWSSFFTDRYENSAASRAFADFKALKEVLQNPQFTEEDIRIIPVLNRELHNLPTRDELKSAGWPKSAGIQPRAILAVSTYLGALDLADAQKATYDTVQNREYHHVFPLALMKEAGITERADRALNCILITMKTNRAIGRKDPLVYLKERIEWANEEDVSQRLQSHLISYRSLEHAHYVGLRNDKLKDKVEADYDAFMNERADLLIIAMDELVKGKQLSVDGIWERFKKSSVSKVHLK